MVRPLWCEIVDPKGNKHRSRVLVLFVSEEFKDQSGILSFQSIDSELDIELIW